MSLRRGLHKVALTATFVGSFCSAQSFADDSMFSRANDLRYGEVLYDYHQGRSFEALSLLDVAKEKGGVVGHGDHPALVEGGLMLAYGMTREAKQTFEAVLKDQVAPESRNAAWFYLGKVFYLEQDQQAAEQALAQVDQSLLAETHPELHQEWHYLSDQLTLAKGDQLEPGEIDSVWRFYVAYNQSVQHFETDPDKAISQLNTALEKLSAYQQKAEPHVARKSADKNELDELQARANLTLGQWHLQLGKNQAALEVIQRIGFESMFAEQALFQLAVAATHLEQYGLALEALNRIQAQDTFTPWLQQVPYALAYLYERMQELPLALQAYQAAGEHYAQRLNELNTQHETLSEQSILNAFKIDQQASDDALLSARASQVNLGVKSISNDAYGHIRVQPIDYSFAYLLSLESFQLGLRDLHELYKLKYSLSDWDQQLESFDFMLDTRAAQRAVRVKETQQALDSQDADQWLNQTAAYTQQIQRALDAEDTEFFMDESQQELKSIIDQVYVNLELLPDDQDKAEYQRKIDRMQAYFTWWINDRYSVNRWAVEKQLKGLKHAMDTFTSQRKVLESELATDQRHQQFESRIVENQARLRELSGGIDAALEQARQHLIAIVESELARQERVIRQYMKEAKAAEARLADVLYQQATAPQSEEPEAQP